MKVCKFGGSSVAEAAQIRKVQRIVEEDLKRRFVVVSAPGKRSASDQKITDLLYLCHSLAEKGESIDEPFGIIRSRYLEIAEELKIGISLEEILGEIGEKIQGGASADYAASRGEYLSGLMIADFLGAEFLDAEKVVRLTDDGQVHESSYQLVAQRVQGNGTIVMPGFYGATLQGELKTFSRGGSDISGAVAARAVQAEVYENWTDVSGILMADPRVADNPPPIGQITYREIREMASVGAGVFHEEAIAPVKSIGIPINVKNTNDPAAPGTLIVAERDTSGAPVVGVSGKKPYRKIMVEKFLLNRYPQFAAQAAEKLRDAGCQVDFELKGFDTLTLFAAGKEKTGAQWNEICRKLTGEMHADSCTVGPEVAMIGVVGEGLAGESRIAARIIGALQEASIPLEAVNYGGSPVTMLAAVPADRGDEAVRVLTGTLAGL